ncbi:hypothetical protein Droror1_Dr00006282 [Drosera rotundifolia]
MPKHTAKSFLTIAIADNQSSFHRKQTRSNATLIDSTQSKADRRRTKTQPNLGGRGRRRVREPRNLRGEHVKLRTPATLTRGSRLRRRLRYSTGSDLPVIDAGIIRSGYPCRAFPCVEAELWGRIVSGGGGVDDVVDDGGCLGGGDGGGGEDGGDNGGGAEAGRVKEKEGNRPSPFQFSSAILRVRNLQIQLLLPPPLRPCLRRRRRSSSPAKTTQNPETRVSKPFDPRSVVSTFDPSVLSFEDDARTRRSKQFLGFPIWGSIPGMIPRWVSFWGFLFLFLITQMLRISGFLGFKHIDIREMRVSISARFPGFQQWLVQ